MRNTLHRLRCTVGVVLSICLVLAMLVPFSAACPFTDVSRNDVGVRDYFDAINWISDNGYMTGTSPGVFSPNSAVTRAMAITVIWRYAGQPNPTISSCPFTDVSPSGYYYNAMLWGYENEIVMGVTATMFCPNNSITHEQIMTFLWRYAKKEIGGGPLYYYDDISSCGDISNVSPSAYTAMRWAVSNGLVLLASPTSNLYPQAIIVRKQLAIFVNRYSSNVDGITMAERYQFANAAARFESGKPSINYRMITQNQLSGLISKLEATSNNQAITAIQAFRLTPWGGACFGMSLTCILDQLGKIAFNEGMSQNCSTMHDVLNLRYYSNPKHIAVVDSENGYNFAKAESAIHYCHFLQKLLSTNPSLVTANGGRIYPGQTSGNGISSFVASRRHCAITLFCYAWQETDASGHQNTYSHAVVVYGHPYSITNGYRYSVYDPSAPNITVWLNVNLSSHTFSLSNNSSITPYQADYVQNFGFLNAYDIDGDGNNVG